jgi:hypothetical protein
MVDKYSVDPKFLEGKPDIVSYITELYRRVADGETVQRVGFTAIEDGNLVVRNGDIIVSETTGEIVLRIMHGETPEVRFYPLGSITTHRATLEAFDFSSTPGTPDQSVQLFIETEPGGVVDGGKVLLNQTGAVLAHQPDASGGEESHLWLNFGFDEIANYRGRWFNQIQSDDHQGLYTGSFVASSGFSTWTHTYFTPFATSIIPIVTVLHSGSTIQWVLDAQSTSAFTVRFSSTTNAKTINFWNFRV